MYSLIGNGVEQFVINSTTGEIRVSSSGVDYEMYGDSNPLQFTVIATDQGN